MEASYHGSALLYRLLERYPADQIAVVECGEMSSPERRLTNVSYHHMRYPLRRLSNTRFRKLVVKLQASLEPLILRAVQKQALLHRPEAVLTVAHGRAWNLAAKISQFLEVPLHLVLHDDFPEMCTGQNAGLRYLIPQFGKVYRAASSRLCVSPFMVEEYRKQFGVDGTVLYPGRAASARFPVPQFESNEQNGPLKYAFAGTLSAPDVVDAIDRLAHAVRSTGGEVRLYGPFDLQQLRARGLAAQNIACVGLVPSDQIIQTLRSEADVLFVPISFAQSVRKNMSIHFPSKLTDYTATGKPILVYGPEYSSAIRWGQQFDQTILTCIDTESLVAAIGRLQDSSFRSMIGQSSWHLGNELFNHDVIERAFLNALRAGEAMVSRPLEFGNITADIH